MANAGAKICFKGYGRAQDFLGDSCRVPRTQLSVPVLESAPQLHMAPLLHQRLRSGCPSCHYLLSSYLWQKEKFAFRLEMENNRDNASLKTNTEEEGGCDRVHLVELSGSVRIGDCQQDAWGIVALCLQMTLVWKGFSVQVWEEEEQPSQQEGDDGGPMPFVKKQDRQSASLVELLAIELAEVLPPKVLDLGLALQGRLALRAGSIALVLPAALPAFDDTKLAQRSGHVAADLGQEDRPLLPHGHLARWLTSQSFNSSATSNGSSNFSVFSDARLTAALKSKLDVIVHKEAKLVQLAALVVPKPVGLALASYPQLANLAVAQFRVGVEEHKNNLPRRLKAQKKGPREQEVERLPFEKLHQYNPGTEPSRILLPMTRFSYAAALSTPLPRGVKVKMPRAGGDSERGWDAQTGSHQKLDGQLLSDLKERELGLRVLLGMDLCWRRPPRGSVLSTLGVRSLLDECNRGAKSGPAGPEDLHFSLLREFRRSVIPSSDIPHFPTNQDGWLRQLRLQGEAEAQADSNELPAWAKNLTQPVEVDGDDIGVNIGFSSSSDSSDSDSDSDGSDWLPPEENEEADQSGAKEEEDRNYFQASGGPRDGTAGWEAPDVLFEKLHRLNAVDATMNSAAASGGGNPGGSVAADPTVDSSLSHNLLRSLVMHGDEALTGNED